MKAVGEKTISCRLPMEICKRVDVVLRHYGITFSLFAREALMIHVEDEEDEIIRKLKAHR